jgi:hypothetical protein
MQKARIDIVTGRDGNDARAGFLGLSYNAQLLLNAPTPASLSRAKGLNRVVRHDFKVDLKADFKVILVTIRA